MEVTLFLLLSHQSFDWSCRTSKMALVSNMEEIVKDIGKLEPEVNISLRKTNISSHTPKMALHGNPGTPWYLDLSGQ